MADLTSGAEVRLGAFARQFGPLYTHPSVSKSYADKVPAIHQISAADSKAHEKSAKDHAAPGPQAENWDPYHSDTSWRLVPTWGAVLRAVTLPEVGGDTIWVNAGLAYETLPDDAKQRLEGRYVTHTTWRPGRKLRAGTLYAALDRLADEKLVEVDREEVVDARLRRYYRLTPPGAQRLAAEVERIRAHSAVAAQRLGLLGGLA